jgi:transposase-like protein
MATAPTIKTLQQAILHFADYGNCHEAVMAIRWPDGKVSCPTCGLYKVAYLEKARVWKCYGDHARAKFSLKVGTIFEDSPIPLQKWLPALWMVVNCKNGISSYELGRALGVTQKSAWFMLSRLRMALHDAPMDKFSGRVEADETMIGGRGRFMHADKRKRLGMAKGRTGSGKVVVAGLLERNERKGGSKVRLKVLPTTRKGVIQSNVRAHVAPGSALITDSLLSYQGLNREYFHGVINHAERYADGHVHTNGMENFWSLLKRAIKGTYVSIEPFHLFRYLDEQSFRFNERGGTDGSRFLSALKGIRGKRLTWNILTGSELEQTC